LHARDEDNRKGKEEGDDEGREVGDPVVGLFGRAGDRRVDGVRVREESSGFSGRRMDDMGDRMGRRGDRGGRVDWGIVFEVGIGGDGEVDGGARGGKHRGDNSAGRIERAEFP
jgi:hypothetical protein